MKIINLTKYTSHLPAKLEDLNKFVLIGREKLISVRAEIRAIKNLEVATEVREQKKEEAQWLAGALLDAEVKIGEIIKQEDKLGKGKTKCQGAVTLEDYGITRNQSSQFQQLADNKEIVEQVKAEAIENEDLPTRSEVLRQIRVKENEDGREQKREELKSIELKTGKKKYRVIYADPPWMYDKGKALSNKYGDVQKHYPSMETEKICELPIADLCQDDCVLFLWATAPKLPEALEIIKSWGFDYKTNIVWDKIKHNFGYYFSVRHELLLIAGKGSSVPDVKELYDSVIAIERSDKHSEKPAYFRELIDKLYTNGNKIELFARDKNKNWDVWGNQI